ncbi:MAG: adenosine deaminase [Chloroflexia bacterium]
MADITELIRRVPKSELHVHLRGAMPAPVFRGLLDKYAGEPVALRASEGNMDWFRQYDNIRPFLGSEHWSEGDVVRLFQSDTFDQFLATFCFVGYFVRDDADLDSLVDGVLASLRAQNVVYAEITISVKEYVRQGIGLASLVRCLDRAASSPGIRVQWIVDLVRDFGVESGLRLLDEISEFKSPSIVGITIGGSEHLFPPEQFAEVYRSARDKGLRLTVHAGEGLGPESVWEALKLGVERIGHGVRAVEDPALVRHLAELGIPLEVCPTSNLRTGMYGSYSEHPVRLLFEAGVPITINSDDPTFFGTSLVDEYMHLQSAGVDERGLAQMLKNGFLYAFLPQNDIRAYLDDLETALGGSA